MKEMKIDGPRVEGRQLSDTTVAVNESHGLPSAAGIGVRNPFGGEIGRRIVVATWGGGGNGLRQRS